MCAACALCLLVCVLLLLLFPCATRLCCNNQGKVCLCVCDRVACLSGGGGGGGGKLSSYVDLVSDLHVSRIWWRRAARVSRVCGAAYCSLARASHMPNTQSTHAQVPRRAPWLLYVYDSVPPISCRCVCDTAKVNTPSPSRRASASREFALAPSHTRVAAAHGGGGGGGGSGGRYGRLSHARTHARSAYMTNGLTGRKSK